MSRRVVLTRLADEFSHHVRVVDRSPIRWLQLDGMQSFNKQTIRSSMVDMVTSYINNGNESIIQPQLDSHKEHISLKCSVLRTYTEYITPSLINDKIKLENILRSSIYTAYNILDKKANTLEGMFGMSPIEIAASIGPLLSNNSIYNDYEQILEILAPSTDILWIQNIYNLEQLKIIIHIAKQYKDDEQIWINIDSSLMNDGGNKLFDFFEIHQPGSIIVVGNQWREINKHLALVKGFTEIAGGTKFGVIIDNKQIQSSDTGNNMDMFNRSVQSDISTLDELWKQNVGDTNDTFDEWNDNILSKASKFWIEQGVSIIGCEWLSGLKIVKAQADEWNRNIGV